MAHQTIHQPSPEQRGFRHGFLRSTWITAVWNWFLMLAGKAAEPVLTISVIYSCARLLPAIHLPVQIDNVVFVAQMVALDIGGLGLRKLANQARRDGNEDGATLASNVSTALITIMCINVGLSVLTSIAHIPGEAVAVIEGILLIARAILAVLYSFVIHSLHPDQGEPQPHDEHLQPDIEALISWSLVGMSSHLQHDYQGIAAEINGRIDALNHDQQDMQDKLQVLETSMPEVDIEAIFKAIMPQLRATFQSQVRAMIEDAQSRVNVMIAEGQSHFARPLPQPEPRKQLEARATLQGQNHAEQPSLKLLNGSKPTPEARANGTPEERLQAAYDLILKNHIRVSGRALAREAHVNRDTASKWLAEVKGQQEEPDLETIVEASCEIEAMAQGQ